MIPTLVSMLAGLSLGAAPVCVGGGQAGESVAEVLHEEAKKAYTAGQISQAAELWREACEQHAHWKWAYNAANALYEDGRFEASYRYQRRAAELGFPVEYQRQLSELRAKVNAALIKDHAYLELTVEPSAAAVERDGEPWARPLEAWTKAASSEISVSLEGYKTARVTWTHALRRRHRRTIKLEPLPKVGTLRISGSPVGALVHVDGDLAGTLPATGELDLETRAGEHQVSVTSGGFAAYTTTVDLPAGELTEVTVTLVELPPPPPDLATPGWILVGAGLGALAVGAGLMVGAESAAQDLEALNSDGQQLATIDYPEYERRYDDVDARRKTLQISGWAVLGVGATSTLAGILLVLLDDDPGVDDSGVTVEPTVGGAKVEGVWRF